MIRRLCIFVAVVCAVALHGGGGGHGDAHISRVAGVDAAPAAALVWPRSRRSRWVPPNAGKRMAAKRRCAVIRELVALNADLTTEQRDEKYIKMRMSPFTFYRGTNQLFWADFANDARLATYGGHVETATWLQGDLHALNFGSFHNNKGKLTYSVNDFDESVVADYQFDVWRMAASLVLCARGNVDPATGRAYVETQADADSIVKAFAESYIEAVIDFGKRKNSKEDDAEFGPGARRGLKHELKHWLEAIDDKRSASQYRAHMLGKWTTLETKAKGDPLRMDIDGNDKLGAVSDAQRRAVTAGIAEYVERLASEQQLRPSAHDKLVARYTIKDMAARLGAGTGSLGTGRYYVLVEGADSDADDDDLILDVKRQAAPSPYVYGSDAFRHQYDVQFGENHGKRVATAYQSMTRRTEQSNGWLALDRTDGGAGQAYFSVRERSPYKDTFPAYWVPGEPLKQTEWEVAPKSVARARDVASDLGRVLAVAHARSDADDKSSGVSWQFDEHVREIVRGKEDGFVSQVVSVARDYAAQVDADYASFVAMLEEPNVAVECGVDVGASAHATLDASCTTRCGRIASSGWALTQLLTSECARQCRDVGRHWYAHVSVAVAGQLCASHRRPIGCAWGRGVVAARRVNRVGGSSFDEQCRAFCDGAARGEAADTAMAPTVRTDTGTDHLLRETCVRECTQKDAPLDASLLPDCVRARNEALMGCEFGAAMRAHAQAR